LVFLVMTATAANAAPFDVTDAWFRSLPGTLTSFAAMIVVLVTMRLNEERVEREAA